MVILKLKAGLGNQMFQYAYAKALAIRNNTEVKIDLSWFDNQPARDTFRYYGLNHFNISADTFKNTKPVNPVVSFCVRAFKKIKRALLKESDFVFYPHLLKINSKKDITVEGYWNTEKYFVDIKNILKKEFSLKDPLGQEAQDAKKEIEQSLANNELPTLVLVRRGDYVSNPHTNSFHGFIGLEYYENALKKMHELLGENELKKVRLFVVSDDIEWVKQNIHSTSLTGQPITYITRPGLKDYEELYLMSLCMHFILANSTFCWWSAWLSETAEKQGVNKIVIGPKKWVNAPGVDTRDVLPESWIRL